MNYLSICRFFLFTAAAGSFHVFSFSQGMTAPYSVYGIGEIDHRTYNTNSGMGYTGLASKTTLYSKGNNPASVAGLPKSFFSLDITTTGLFRTYSGTPVTASNSQNRDFVIKALSFNTKITSFWGSSFGFRQFSNVSYKFATTKQVQGSSDTYPAYYSGDGGLNQYYWNNAFNLGKHFSVGILTSLIAGGINQTETIIQTSADSLQSTRKDYFNNFKIDYGLIYTQRLNKNWDLSFGGLFSNRTRLNADRTLTVKDNATVITSDKFIKYNSFSLPVSLGTGLSLSNNKGLTIAFDFKHEDWSSLGIAGTGWTLTNSDLFSAGIELANFSKSYYKGLVKKSIQFGAFYENSYLVINSNQIKEYGLSAGITRTAQTGLMYGFSIEGGSLGTTKNNLIQQNFVQFTLSVSLKDRFLSKGHLYN